jgi:hypothetical protein
MRATNRKRGKIGATGRDLADNLATKSITRIRREAS